MMSVRDSPFSNSLYFFVATDLAPHRNPVTCVLAGLDGTIVVSGGGERVEGDVVLIRPGVEHGVEIRGRARVLYLNGLDFPSQSTVADVFRGSLESLAMIALDGDRAAQDELRVRLSQHEKACRTELVEVLMDIDGDPMSRMTQAELANRLRMERTRAQRYFKAVTGMTFRGFKLWSGVQAAARKIADGERVRTAAMDAGFADTAHLTRTFRSVFGITPVEATADRRR